jgi:cytidylate kinase
VEINEIKLLLNGRACSGKDTVADYLKSRYGFVKFSFASGIYEIAYDLFEMNMKDRPLLQGIGQKMREIKPDVWVQKTYKMSELCHTSNDQLVPVVITDCRQANEYLRGIELGYIPVRITAPLEYRVRRALVRDNHISPDNPFLDTMVKHVINGETEPHQSYHLDISKWENDSENGADNFDYIEINNIGDMSDLTHKVDLLILGLHNGTLLH